VRNADAVATTGDVLQVHSRIDGTTTCWAFAFHPADATPTEPPLVDDAAFMASGTAPLTWSGAWIAEKATPVGTSYFALDASTLTYGFQIATDAAPVVFQGSISIRNDHTEGGSPCL
jgi:hypothetical protein